MLKSLLKKLLPSSFLNYYHKFMAKFAAFWFGYPSEKLIVIGVTGTNGKSSTTALIAKVLEAGGNKVGATSTVLFKIADREWLNDKKMTMVGRFQLQKLLSDMVKAGCHYAVVETSSEGIKQYRHLGINYDYAVFTNLTPEHIESHGSFENYKKAKGQLFAHLTAKPHKFLLGKEIPKTIIVNKDDEHAQYFASFTSDKVLLYSAREDKVDGLSARGISVSPLGTSFEVNGQNINLKLLGAFNVYNCLPAIIIGLEEGIAFSSIKEKLESVNLIPGRMELIDEGQNFWVMVDYAPEVASMKKMYETVNQFRNGQLKINKIIHVLGSCGGGRDKARRPILGQIAAQNADFVIVTNEDPYDDDPMDIIEEVAKGAISAGKAFEVGNLFKIIDRKAAIAKALSLAQEHDLVLVTGKGAEQAMAVANGKHIPWDDREVIREALRVNRAKNV